MSLSALQGAPLAGAATLFASLYAGSTSHCALGRPAVILGEGASSYVEVRGAHRISDNGGGGDIKKTPAARLNAPDQSDSPEESLKSRIEHTVLLLTDDMPVQVKEDVDRTMKSLVSDIERMWNIMTQNGGSEQLTLEQYIEHNLPQWVMNQRLQLAYPRYLKAIEDGRLERKVKETTKPCKTSNFFSSPDPEKYAPSTTVGTGRRFLKIEEDGLWRGTKVLFEGRVAEITRVTPSCWLVLDDIEHLRIPWSVKRVEDDKDYEKARTIFEYINAFEVEENGYQQKRSEKNKEIEAALEDMADDVKRLLPQLVRMLKIQNARKDIYWNLWPLVFVDSIYTVDDIPMAIRMLASDDRNSQIAGAIACSVIECTADSREAVENAILAMGDEVKRVLPLVLEWTESYYPLGEKIAERFTYEDLPLVVEWVDRHKGYCSEEIYWIATAMVLQHMGDKIRGRAEFVPAILNVLKRIDDADFVHYAIHSAGYIGAPAIEAIPLIAEAAPKHSTSWEELENALLAIKWIHEDYFKKGDEDQPADNDE